MCSRSSDDEEASSKKRKRTADNQTAGMKAELKHLLSQPLLAKGVSAKYLTSGTKDVVSSLLNSKGECLLPRMCTSFPCSYLYSGHEAMVGYAMEDARRDLAQGKKSMLKKSKASAKKKRDAQEEEWTGFGS